MVEVGGGVVGLKKKKKEKTDKYPNSGNYD